MSFVDLSSLGLASTPQDLLDTWLAQIQATYPGYAPSPANLEYLQALAVSYLASDVAQVGVAVPPAIFRNFGTKLHNLPYQNGLPAVASVQVTAIDTLGHTLPAGQTLTLGPWQFYTLADLTIPAASSTGVVTVVATSAGTAYNGATNPTEFDPLVDWILSATALAPASGGIDQESDSDYQNRLVGLLRLIKPTVTTADDAATMALSFAPTAGTDQEFIGRATSLDGYVQSAASFTVTTVNTNAVLTVTGAPGTGITAAEGATITGTNIPAGTLVISSTSGTITMSKTATGSGSGITATVGGTLGNDKNVTTCVTLADGTATNADTKTALQAWLASFREVNFVMNVIDPTYTPVYVLSSVHLYQGFDPAATQAAVQAALMAYLSPSSFRLPPFGDIKAWLNSSVIHINTLIGIIDNVPGVDYIVPGSVKVGTGASPTGTGDLTLPGPCALPTSTSSTVSLPTIV